MTKLFLIFPLFILMSTTFSFTQGLDQVEEYKSLNDEFLNNSSSGQEILNQLSMIENGLSPTPTSFGNQYLLSQIHLLQGYIYFDISDTEASVDALKNAQNSAQKAIELKNDADCWRIKAEAGTMIMLQLGLPYIIANAGTVQEQTDMAINLDKNNLRALVLSASGLINKPFIFGGNVNEGVKKLERINLSDSSKSNRFYVLYNLSIAYKKQGNSDKAETTCKKALLLYPQNKAALELLKKL